MHADGIAPTATSSLSDRAKNELAMEIAWTPEVDNGYAVISKKLSYDNIDCHRIILYSIQQGKMAISQKDVRGIL